MRVAGETLDDLLFQVLKKLLKAKRVSATRGSMREQIGAHLILSDPRARFSKTEKRATLFSCIAEALWYLTGSDELKFIEHYITDYRKHLEIPKEATSTPGAYGPRLFAPKFETSEIGRVIRQLRDRHSTRKAVVQLFGNADAQSHDPPCTCVLQFFVRESKVELIAFMRSNDAYVGLPHDVFAFTWIQELVASSLGRDVGPYQHMVGSLHLYDSSSDLARDYLKEGWQKKTSMPIMPSGDPWPSIAWLLKTESKIRSNPTEALEAEGVAPYWQDIARLLKVRELIKLKQMRDVVREKNRMSSPIYDDFIRSKSHAIKDRQESQLFPDLLSEKSAPR